MDGTWDDILAIVTWFDQVEIGSSWADQMEEGEAMYERDRPTQKVFILQLNQGEICQSISFLTLLLFRLSCPLHLLLHSALTLTMISNEFQLFAV